MWFNFALKSGHVIQQVLVKIVRLPVGLAMACNSAVSKLFTMILSLKVNTDLSLITIYSGSLNVDRIRDGRK